MHSSRGGGAARRHRGHRRQGDALHPAGDAEIAVAVLTAPLRRMFQRLGVNLVPLAKADPARLGPERAIWGSYYENDPVVCAGLVAEGQARLARFAARIERQAA